MNKLRWLTFLMGITILGIAGFQFYWLRENYIREKKSLALKSEFLFKETIQQLQVKKLNLGEPVFHEGNELKVQIYVSDGKKPIKVTRTVKNNVISKVDLIRKKLKDSNTTVSGKGQGAMFITMDSTMMSIRPDSAKFTRKILPGTNPDQLYRLLYSVDSLQEPLLVNEIDSAYGMALSENGLDISYTILQRDSAAKYEEEWPNEITVGMVHPITYRLSLENTVSYLMKRISLPILFSIILLGITILSFILLYRNLRKQQRLAALKNEFISNITHELKTPIATVGVAIEALKSFNAIGNPERTKEYLDISSNELHRLSLMVDKVLKLSIFDQKGIELKYEELNMDELVQEVLSSLKLQLEKKQSRVIVVKEGDLDFRGDRLHLVSMIFNLLDNAIKYSAGPPEINIKMKETENSVELEISDKGIGIPPEYKEKVFEKFFRVPHGDTHNAKGYGLGLSYAAQVIRQHGGTIHCESQPGEGSQFIISLPKDEEKKN